MSSSLKTILIPLLLAVVLSGQFSNAGDAATCGFQAGGNFAKFDGSAYDDESEFRLRFGLFASAGLFGRVSYQAELNYVQKGGFGESVYVNYLYDSTWFDVEAQLDYIEIPLLLKFDLLPESPLRPVLSGGGYVAWVLEKHYEGNHYQPAKSDFGLLFGFGFQPVIHGRMFILEMRYTGGIKKIIDDPLGSRLTNKTLSFTLGVGL